MAELAAAGALGEKDPEIAADVTAIEADRRLSPSESRRRVLHAVRARYAV